jgi:tetratricopeptide (TPR) repeat protein
MATVVWATLTAALGPFFAFAAPHGELDEQIARVTARIRAEAPQGELFLVRARLEREHGDHELALADLDRAAGLAVAAPMVELERGRVFVAAGRYALAEEALDRCLGARPDDVDALLLRARARARCGRPALAVADFDRALELAPSPRPDDYLARADAAAAVAPTGAEHCLAGIERGIARLGPAVALVMRAVELEVELGRTDAALARLDALVRAAPRAEAWVAKRAEILSAAGRVDEARAAWRDVLARSEALPPRIRSGRAALELCERARTQLRSLQRGSHR